MATDVPQLSTLTKSLAQDMDGRISVSGRPLIQNMNSVSELTGANPSLLPSKSCSTSTEWYSALADMHLVQVAFQHNILDEEDARDKYISRQVFRRLATQGRLTSRFDAKQTRDTGSPFWLYSKDLRPSKVLIDRNLCIVGIIDLEFAIAAQAQLFFDPPWWLPLKNPEYWPVGYASWMERTDPD